MAWSTQTWQFSTTVTEPPTGAQARLNASDQATATLLWLAYTTTDGADLSHLLPLVLPSTDRIVLQDFDDSARWQRFLVSGAATDKGTYLQVPVQWQAGGLALPAQKVLVAFVEADSAGPPGTSGGSTLADPATVRKALDVDTSMVSDAEILTLCQAVDASLLPLLTPDHIDEMGQVHSHPNCAEAAAGVAVQVWQSRYAPGGQVVGGDFAAQFTPHLLGPGLVMRYVGLLSPCMPHGGAVVG